MVDIYNYSVNAKLSAIDPKQIFIIGVCVVYINESNGGTLPAYGGATCDIFTSIEIFPYCINPVWGFSQSDFLVNVQPLDISFDDGLTWVHERL